MNKKIIKINKIPFRIKNKLIFFLYTQKILVGYKQICNKYKTPIIELPDKKRIWMLKYEVK
uniref:Cytochrome b6-f complex subunit PetP n=1 Tax=Osmundea sinicola TaxID=290685 RepID=A0A7L4WNT0_9FLOR|nr:cytochrome b6-f complex subunit PetP [Osmundea sinicola]QFR99914.1 cytochrome b6-f complex subunit PetP [Osmundea sinicola]